MKPRTRETLRLAWLRANAKYIKISKSNTHLLHYRRGATEIYADTILRVVDAALKELKCL